MGYYAGIGSRQTPIGILALMELLAYKLAMQGHTLRSGAARGADQAFEAGCDNANGKKQIFIPWEGFQGRSLSTDPEMLFIGASSKAFDLAAELHPNWGACNQAARQLHARNCHQILGPDLDTPVNDVICWTPNGSGSGGTGQALRLARRLGIPIWDLGNHDTYLKLHALSGAPSLP